MLEEYAASGHHRGTKGQKCWCCSGCVPERFEPPEPFANLSLILQSGALPAPITYLGEQLIGPSLGADSIRHGVTASILGLLLIMTFMR
jgi:hypothetical protein